MGVCATASAATLAAFRAPGGAGDPSDFIAQRVVADPWTAGGGRKADLRVLVVVRSFGGGGSRGGDAPPTPSASLYTRYHARLAPAVLPADLGTALIAPGAFSTVSCYDEDRAGGGGGGGHGGGGGDGPATHPTTPDPHSFLSRDGVDAALAASGADPAAVQASLADIARHVVTAGAAAVGGPWPRSAAFYGMDVMLDSACFAPHLLEVNFCPDLAVAAGFRPGLPGDLLAEMFGGGAEAEAEEGVFVELF
jgi:hypothetical protein